MPFKKGHTLWNHPNCKKSQFKRGEARHTVPHSEESKLKMSESRKGKKLGSANPSWKGGVTPLLIKLKRLTEYKAWQKSVFTRDNYTCRSCFVRGSKTLTAHHLVSFSFIVQMLKVRSVHEAREQIMLWDIRNGVTLCADCHKKTSNYAWRASKRPRDRVLYKVALLFVIFFAPVFSHAATFGYTSIGGTGSSALAENTVRVTSYAPSLSGVLIGMSVYSTANGGLIQTWKGVVYNNDSGDSLVAYGAGKTDDTTSGGWFTDSFNREQINGGTNYLIGWWFETTNSTFWTGNYDTVGGVNLLRDDLVYSSGAPNDPFVTDSTISDRAYSFYAIYDDFPSTLRINNGTLRINNGTLDL